MIKYLAKLCEDPINIFSKWNYLNDKNALI